MRRGPQPTPEPHAIRGRAAGAGLATAAGLLARLPEPAARALAERIGGGSATLNTRAHRIARANLQLVYPELGKAEREALLRSHLRHLGRSAAEWARLPEIAPEALSERVEITGLAHLVDAAAADAGVLVATAHFGFWELILPALRLRLVGRDVTAVAHPQRNPWIRAQVEARRRFANGPEPLRQDARAILRALAGGAAVGVLADHYLSPRRGGRLAPFLGRAAWTNPGPAALALRADCPLLPAHIRPLPNGRHRIEIGAPLAAAGAGDRAYATQHLTEALNAAIGGWIRAQPQLWLWSHARFRGSPDVDADAYARAVSRRSRANPWERRRRS
jgi:KDO2-lipid IV(A) lauroyltransferase